MARFLVLSSVLALAGAFQSPAPAATPTALRAYEN